MKKTARTKVAGLSFERSSDASCEVQRACCLSRRAVRRLVSFAGGSSVCAWASLANRSAFKCGLFASGNSLSFVFDHRLSAVLDALFPLEISFCALSGLI
jgi:hypothetical protein